MNEHTGRDAADLIGLGTFVREHRTAQGMTQPQLAERLGWTQERLSRIEDGTYGMPSVPALARLARGLATSLLQILRAAGFDDRTIASIKQAPAHYRETRAGYYAALQRLFAIGSTSLPEALDGAADMVAEVMGADRVDALMHQPETESLVTLGSSNTPIGRRAVEMGMDRLPLVTGGREVEVFETGIPYQSHQATDDPGVPPGYTKGPGGQSLIIVPLTVRGARRGVLVAASSRQDRFVPADVHFLETVARWVGMVAHHAERAEGAMMESRSGEREGLVEGTMAALAHDLTVLTETLERLRREVHEAGQQEYQHLIEDAYRAAERIRRMIEGLPGPGSPPGSGEP